MDEKVELIHRIINGEKQKISKPKAALFSFGSKPAVEKEEKTETATAPIEITSPSNCKDVMVTAQPLSTVFAFYRYYLL